MSGTAAGPHRAMLARRIVARCRRRWLAAGTLVALAWATAGAAPESPPAPAVFEEVAARAGVRFVVNPSRSPQKHQPETMSSGVALLDYDGDGDLDLYAVDTATMPGLVKTLPAFSNRLFRNDGVGAWSDVTEQAGVAGKGYDMGVATGDYDNDGDVDLLVLGLRGNLLYRNEGHGRFSDVTAAAGLARLDPAYGRLWSVAAAFLDYDRDGDLDLFVANYCLWNPATEIPCGEPGARDYCHPDYYDGLPNSLYRNQGDGTFTDVSAASGIRRHVGKGMGLGVSDFDQDGWPDVFVSNDTLPAFLFLNRGDGTFEEAGAERGVGVTERGQPISGMGADARDVDGDGRADIFQTAMLHEQFPLYRNLGAAQFEDVTTRSGLGALTARFAGWSNGIYDFNNDGLKDLFVACASTADPGSRFGDTAAMPNAVFLQTPRGRFADGSPGAGADFARKAIHRGAAFGDIDNDGRVDAVVTALEAPLEIWRNVSPARNHWLLVALSGTKSNRDGQGARLELVTRQGRQHNEAKTSVGYGSASDPRVHFGLGSSERVESLTVTWPSGRVQRLNGIAADQILALREP